MYCYAECHLCSVSIMLSVTNKPIMLSVIMLNVVILSVLAPNLCRKPFQIPNELYWLYIAMIHAGHYKTAAFISCWNWKCIWLQNCVLFVGHVNEPLNGQITKQTAAVGWRHRSSLVVKMNENSCLDFKIKNSL